jgi:hypothetical protein
VSGELPPPLPPPPVPGVPWERRDQIGLVNALVETTQQVLLSPGDFFGRMAVTGGVGGPLLYAVIVGYIGLAAASLYNVVFNSMFGAGFLRFGRQARLERLMPLLHSGTSLVAQLVLGPVWIVIGLFVGAGIVHVFLMLVGGANRDFEATFRVAAYSHAVALLNLIPFCGGFIGLVWWIVVASTGLALAHQTTQGRALAAVLLPIVLICCCCALVAGLALGGIGAALSQWQR